MEQIKVSREKMADLRISTFGFMHERGMFSMTFIVDRWNEVDAFLASGGYVVEEDSPLDVRAAYRAAIVDAGAKAIERAVVEEEAGAVNTENVLDSLTLVAAVLNAGDSLANFADDSTSAPHLNAAREWEDTSAALRGNLRLAHGPEGDPIFEAGAALLSIGREFYHPDSDDPNAFDPFDVSDPLRYADRVKREIQGYKEGASVEAREGDRARKEASALRAENERMRGVVEMFMKWWDNNGDTGPLDLAAVATAARAALAGKAV